AKGLSSPAAARLAPASRMRRRLGSGGASLATESGRGEAADGSIAGMDNKAEKQTQPWCGCFM
ncbi:hypothetical protein BRN30_14770, partial [Xanthomonas oryzae pv. oryzae]